MRSPTAIPHPRTVLASVAKNSAGLELNAWPAGYVSALVSAGLGPTLYHLAHQPDAGPLEAGLAGADLTARLLSEGVLDAAEEILRAAGSAADEIILLKGIAACQRHYPLPHLRVMGDIDLLAPPAIYTSLQSTLDALGYVQTSDLPPEFFATHHHAMPFYHPAKRQWIEVHRALFPDNSVGAREDCFAFASLQGNTVPIQFRGVTARCLRDELHLIYVCSHWGRGLNLERGLIPIVDVLHVLRAAPTMDWDWIWRSVGNGSALRHLCLMLGYLQSREVIDLDPRNRAMVARGVRKIGRANFMLLCALIDRYLVLRQPRGRILSDHNIGIMWDTLLRDRPAYANLCSLPLALIFPPHREDRFRPAFAARRAWSVLRGRKRHAKGRGR